SHRPWINAGLKIAQKRVLICCAAYVGLWPDAEIGGAAGSWRLALRQAHREYRALARLARHCHVATHHARELASRFGCDVPLKPKEFKRAPPAHLRVPSARVRIDSTGALDLPRIPAAHALDELVGFLRPPRAGLVLVHRAGAMNDRVNDGPGGLDDVLAGEE